MDTVDVRELMKTDHDFHGYAENYSPRSYADGGLKPTDGSDIELEPQDLYGEPIVVIDGCVRDGWSRAAAHFKAGDFMVQAWVALPPLLKEAGEDDVDPKAYALTLNIFNPHSIVEKMEQAGWKYVGCQLAVPDTGVWLLGWTSPLDLTYDMPETEYEAEVARARAAGTAAVKAESEYARQFEWYAPGGDSDFLLYFRIPSNQRPTATRTWESVDDTDDIDPKEYAMSLPVFDPQALATAFNKRYEGARCAKLEPLNTLSQYALGWYPPPGQHTPNELEDLSDTMRINGIADLKQLVPTAYDVWFATNRGVYPYVIYFRLPEGTRTLGEANDPDAVDPKSYAMGLECFDPKQLALSVEAAGWADARCHKAGDVYKLGFDNPNPNIRDAEDEFYAPESERARASAEDILGAQCPEAEVLEYFDHCGYNDYELYFSLPPGVHALTDHKPAPVRESADPDDVDPLAYADATFDIDTVMAKLGFEKQAKSWRKIYAATPPLNHEWMIGVKPTRDVNLGACFDATMYAGDGPSWSEFWSQYWLSAVALPSVIQQFEQHMDGSPILSESAEPLPDVDDPATVLKNNAVDLLTNELTRLGFESNTFKKVKLSGGGNPDTRWLKTYKAADFKRHCLIFTIFGDNSLRFNHWNTVTNGWDTRALECTGPSPAYSANVIRDMDAAMQRCVADSLQPDPEHAALKRVVDHYAQQRMEWLNQNVNFGGEEGDIGTEQMRLERMIQRNR